MRVRESRVLHVAFLSFRFLCVVVVVVVVAFYFCFIYFFVACLSAVEGQPFELVLCLEAD